MRSGLTLLTLVAMVVVGGWWGWSAMTEPFPQEEEIPICVDTTVEAGTPVLRDQVVVSVYNGTSMTVARGSSAEAAVFRPGVTDTTSNMAHSMVLGATCTAEAGRIFAYGDSSIANDGTGGDNRNAWTEDWKSHRRMLLNATEWTARVY